VAQQEMFIVAMNLLSWYHGRPNWTGL